MRCGTGRDLEKALADGEISQEDFDAVEEFKATLIKRKEMAENKPFCSDCPDHEACMQGYPCDMVKAVAETREELK